MNDEQIAATETPEEAKRRHDRDRKRLQRSKERSSKAEAAAELAATLASEQARVDAETRAKERFEFLKIELEPPRLPGAQGLTDTTAEGWNAVVEDEIDMYLASLSCANDFERLFKYLSVVLPSLLVHRGVTPLSHDELLDMWWAEKGFNGSRPSNHEPVSTLLISSPSVRRTKRCSNTTRSNRTFQFNVLKASNKKSRRYTVSGCVPPRKFG